MRRTSSLQIGLMIGAGGWVMLTGGLAGAATYTWDGGGTAFLNGTYFNDSQNWVGNVAPPSSADVVLQPPFSSGTNILLAAPRTVRSLAFKNAANVNLTYDFGGPFPLTLSTGDLQTTGAGTTKIGTDVVLGSMGDWTIEGVLRVTGAISGGAGPLVSGLRKLGGGTLELMGTNSWVGVSWVTKGTLRVRKNTALPSSTILFIDGDGLTVPTTTIDPGVAASVSEVWMEGGAVLNGAGQLQAGSIDLWDQAVVNATLTGTPAIDVQPNATPTIQKAGTHTGTTTVHTGASLHITTGGALGAPGSTLVLEDGELALDSSSALLAGRAIHTTGNSRISNASSVASDISGNGYLDITSGPGGVTFTGDNTAFTGALGLDGEQGHTFTFPTAQSFGGVYAQVYGAATVDIEASLVTTPTIELGADSTLWVGAQTGFSALRLAGDVATLVVEATTHFEGIYFDGPAGSMLFIDTSGGPDIYIDVLPSTAELQCINFVGAQFQGASVMPAGSGGPFSGWFLRPAMQSLPACGS